MKLFKVKHILDEVAECPSSSVLSLLLYLSKSVQYLAEEQ